jgi:hypothetical protein
MMRIEIQSEGVAVAAPVDGLVARHGQDDDAALQLSAP